MKHDKLDYVLNAQGCKIHTSDLLCYDTVQSGRLWKRWIVEDTASEFRTAELEEADSL